MLMAVAATFLTISATSALAQSDPTHKSAADLAIEAAVPMPEPANVPPPTAGDFKMDSTAAVPDAGRASDTKSGDGKSGDAKAAETKTPEIKTPEIKTPEIKAPDIDICEASI